MERGKKRFDESERMFVSKADVRVNEPFCNTLYRRSFLHKTLFQFLV